MRINEDVDPRMKGREYRDCAKGAHMVPVARQHFCPTCQKPYACDASCNGLTFEREVICKDCPQLVPTEAEDVRKLRLVKDALTAFGRSPADRVDDLLEILTGSCDRGL